MTHRTYDQAKADDSWIRDEELELSDEADWYEFHLGPSPMQRGGCEVPDTLADKDGER